MTFQLTRPRGARHGSAHVVRHIFRFQLTRPRGARRRHRAEGPGRPPVSTHAPARGATTIQRSQSSLTVFQLTRPRGARRGCSCEMRRYVLRFQLTRPRGARPPSGTVSRLRAMFQLTRPRGARRQCILGFQPGRWVFQLTRPRGARPQKFDDVPKLSAVSTHAPARGATPNAANDCDDTGEFQLTRPRGARPRG